MKRSIFLSINVLLTTLTTACSTTGNGSQHSLFQSNNIVQEQMAAITKESGAAEMFFIEVPSPNNIISEKLMLATLATGMRSNVIDQLVELLSLNKNLIIGVVGESQSINTATVKRAMEDAKKKAASGTIFLVGNEQTQATLNALAVRNNLKFVIAHMP